MKSNYPIQQDIAQITSLVTRYFEGRLQHQPITSLNLAIRDLRIVMQRVITDYYLQLSLTEERHFRGALTDQLAGAIGGLYVGKEALDREHRQYCLQEIIACFEWAEQIKAEVPNDPITQKILAIDIPILRPFDYGFASTKPPHSHQKKR